MWFIRAKVTEGSSVVVFTAKKGLWITLELCFTLLLEKLYMAVVVWPEMCVQCSGPNICTSPLKMMAWIGIAQFFFIVLLFLNRGFHSVKNQL